MTDQQLRHAVIVQVARVESAVRANVRGEIDYGALAEARRKAIDTLMRMLKAREATPESR